MKFDLSDDQKLLQQRIGDFARNKIAPGVDERDENEFFDRTLYDEMGSLGLTGLCYSRDLGGAGGTYLDFALAVEEVSKTDDSLASSLSASVFLCQWPISQYGTEDQKQKYLKPLAEGRQLGAFALTERNAGSDVAGMKTTAVRQGGEYILNGGKIFITNGGEAETYVVFAMTDPAKGSKGISAFILSKGLPGFNFGKREKKMGIRGSVTRELIFENVKVPADQLLGAEGQGFKIAMTALDGGRIGVAAQAVGIGQAALDHAIRYAKERVQFGKPIASQQIVAFMLANMATRLEAARLLTYQAAYAKDEGRPFSKEAAMAKSYASDTAMAIATDAVQIFGGNGFSREYPVERLMRNAKITQIYEGTNQIQNIVIASALLR